jgi:hypothetical protein
MDRLHGVKNGPGGDKHSYDGNASHRDLTARIASTATSAPMQATALAANACVKLAP